VVVAVVVVVVVVVVELSEVMRELQRAVS